MRTLLLLRGAPGAGKSTWIKENHLEPYTLEADRFRTLISSPVLNNDGDLAITQAKDGNAWGMLYQALEERMKNGDFTVIDATHSNPRRLDGYKKLAKKYRYRIYYREFDVPLDELYRRNELREEYKRVPVKEIERIYAMQHETNMQSFAKEIKDLSEINNYYTGDLNKYEKVMVIGDIHGCYTALMELLNGGIDEKTFYIFLGDYLDRGIENKEVLDFLMKHAALPNVFLLEGNHDAYISCYANDDWPNPDRKPAEFIYNTAPALEAGLTADEIKNMKTEMHNFARRFVLCCPFVFGKHKVFTCHGGISSVPLMTLIPGFQMVKGVGNYSTEIDKAYEDAFMHGKTQGFIQIHGHRATTSTEHSISLEGDVEHGGELKAMVFTKDDMHLISVKNTVFAEHRTYLGYQKKADSIIVTKNETSNALISSKNINVKRQDEHNLISLNFSREAFYKKNWDEQTIKARGLFIDATTGDIKLRSYNKFFNMYEMPETNPKALNENLAFPIKVYRKDNGFLGIYSVVDGQDVFASKSTIIGGYVEMFKEVFMGLTDAEKNAFHGLAEANNCSFVFEVRHLNDRHIIDFDSNRLTLLDAIQNKYDINGIDIDEKFSDFVCSKVTLTSDFIERKVLLCEFYSIDQLTEYCKSRKHDRTIEGVVCQDRNGYMFKVKMHYYTVIKQLRGVLQYVVKNYNCGVRYGRLNDAREIKFASWLAGRTFDEIKNLHIIDAVKWYEKENGLLMEVD